MRKLREGLRRLLSRPAAAWGLGALVLHSLLALLVFTVEGLDLVPSWDAWYTLQRIEPFFEDVARARFWQPLWTGIASITGLQAMGRLWGPVLHLLWGGLAYFLAGALLGSSISRLRKWWHSRGESPSRGTSDVTK